MLGKESFDSNTFFFTNGQKISWIAECFCHQDLYINSSHYLLQFSCYFSLRIDATYKSNKYSLLILSFLLIKFLHQTMYQIRKKKFLIGHFWECKS